MNILKAPKLAIATLMSASVLIAGLSVSVGVEPAHAQRTGGKDEDQQKKRRTKKAQVIRDDKLSKVLQEAVELMTAEPPDYAGAIAAMKRTPDMDKLTSYERTKVHQINGQIAAQQERYPEAIVAFDAMLKEEDVTEADREQVTFTLAQLYMVTEKYQTAVNLLENWFQTAQNPNPGAYFWLCQGYIQLEKFAQAIDPCTTTIRVAQEREQDVKESWVRAVIISYQQNNDLVEASNWIKFALVNWPKRDYWIQYVSMLSQRGLEKDELATYEIAYNQGFLTRESEVVRIAQMYQFNQIPYKAVKVLEKGFADGIIEESRKNLELLANVYTLAREYGDAVDPLAKAATLANEGKLWERLAQVYIQDEEWSKASDALQMAIRAGGLNNPFRTRILEGMSLANSGKFGEARVKFNEAKKVTDDQREIRQIRGWLRYVDDEQRRAKDIRDYRIKKYGAGAN